MFYFLSDNSYPLHYISSGKFIANGEFTHPKRNLDTFVILVGISGKLFITQDDRDYELGPNQAMILYPGHMHFGTQHSSQNLSYYWCHFKIEGAGRGYRLVSLEDIQKCLRTDPGCEQNQPFSSCYILPEFCNLDSTSRVILIFRQLLDLTQRRCYSNRLVNYTLSLLAMEITQETLDNLLAGEQPEKKMHYNLQEIMDWIAASYSENLSVKKIAAIFNYNPDYLSTAFKKNTGMSLTRYLNHTKIAAAKKLLLNSSLSVKYIAKQVGFHDEKHFMKVFKQLEDLTPSQYRCAFYKQKMNKE